MRIPLILSMLVAAWPLAAEVKLPALISDHMLLQCDRPVHVWGKAEPGERVAVEFRGEKAATQADTMGRWSVYLAPVKAGGPFELTVAGANTITVKDVLVGEVWVASGQSNMGFTVGRGNDAEKEIAAAKYPRIRWFQVPNKVSPVALDDVEGKWVECSPEVAGRFSGAAYFFARHLHQQKNVPVGVIQSAWGGTPADAWTRASTLAADPALISVFADWAKLMDAYPDNQARYERARKNHAAAVAKAKAEGKAAPAAPRAPVGPDHQWMPGGLYNAMIAPLTPYAIRGAIWYQGENNASKRRAYVYRRLFAAMIEDWRNAWGMGEFPFLWVQLANYAKTGDKSEWPELREAQTMALRLSNTGQALAIDIGDANDIHPTNKQDVGLRLALAARAVAYGEKIVYSGPSLRQASVEGKTMRVWFDSVGGGLKVKGDALKGFQVAGADRQFVAAEARIDGASVVVSNAKVAHPVYVRYAWADNPECNLYNAENLPAVPFRTDEWQEPKEHR